MTPHQVLSKYWGYKEFRPLQLDIIESVLQGHDTIGLLPTGGGKSITFQIPALILPHLTIVVTPLISLMKDQIDNMHVHHIPAAYIHSGLTLSEKNRAMDRCRLGKVKMLYLSPEKLQSAAFLDDLRFMKLSMIVVDEAHCISQWGHDFRPSYLKISKVRELFPSIPILALTATATPPVRRDISESLQMRDPQIFALSFVRNNLSYIIRHTENKTLQLLRTVTAVKGSQIVYVRSRKKARELAIFLSENGVDADFYHAGLEPEEKSERQQRWKTGEMNVIVATNAFGMGIDKADVRAVIHYDIPTSIEEYYQEVGRAGRDGKHAWAVTLVSTPDKGVLSRRLSESFPPRDYIKDIYEKACAFMGVSVGGGFNNTYDFNFALFCDRHNLSVSPTRNSMEILCQAGLFEFNEDFRSSARILMTVQREELYNIHLDTNTDKVLDTVMRLYTGIFTDYAHINESVIACTASIAEETVYESLLKLSRMKVLHYVPRRLTPYIYFPTSREERQHVLIPQSVYEHRRQQMSNRIEAIKSLMFNNNECRSTTILRYFGEAPEQDCGHCDVCRQRKNAISSSNTNYDDIKKSVKYLCGRPNTIKYILEQFDSKHRNNIISYIRHLADNGTITLDPIGNIKPINNPSSR